MLSKERHQNATGPGRALNNAGYSFLTDIDLENNEHFADAIDKRLRRSKIVLVLWTTKSATSDWVRLEARHGFNNNRYLGVELEPVGELLPFDLQGLNRDVVAAGRGLASVIPEIVSAVSNRIGASSAPILNPSAEELDFTADIMAFETAARVDTKLAYQHYLEKFPEGFMAAEAQARRQKIGTKRYWLEKNKMYAVTLLIAVTGVGALGLNMMKDRPTRGDLDTSKEGELTAQLADALKQSEVFATRVTELEKRPQRSEIDNLNTLLTDLQSSLDTARSEVDAKQVELQRLHKETEELSKRPQQSAMDALIAEIGGLKLELDKSRVSEDTKQAAFEACLLVAAPSNYLARSEDGGENGVDFDDLKPELAIPICSVALAIDAGNASLHSLLGRAFNKSGQYEPARENYEIGAQAGDWVAQNNLGAIYEGGDGVERDYEEAVAWYRKAAEQGIPIAQTNLGLMYENGRGVEPSDEEAVAWYRKAAGQGYAEAQYSLGWMYTNGRGVEPSDEEAVTWYRKAAEQGYARAQNNLGWIYANRRGVDPSDEEAVAWYRKAAEQGYAEAQNNLGVMYAEGDGVEKSDEEAVIWYRKAAEQGYARAQSNLGWMYYEGLGVVPSDEEAVAWYRKAAEQGYAKAQYNLGWMYENGRGVEPSDEEAVTWYRRAAEQGHAKAQNSLGRMYEIGRGVEPSDEEAVAWYRKAAEQGYARAQNNLGWMYYEGHGVDPSDEEAVAWYRKAAEQGYAKAQFNLGWMYENGRGVEPNDEEAVAWYRKAAEQGYAKAARLLAASYFHKEVLDLENSIEEAFKWLLRAANGGDSVSEHLVARAYMLALGTPQNDEKSVDFFIRALQNGIDVVGYSSFKYGPFETVGDDDWVETTVIELQKRLRSMGFYRGAIDGKMGPETQSAMRELLPEQ